MKRVNGYEVLAGQFDDFMNRAAKTNGADYYSRLATRDFVELADINNVAKGFAEGTERNI